MPLWEFLPLLVVIAMMGYVTYQLAVSALSQVDRRGRHDRRRCRVLLRLHPPAPGERWQLADPIDEQIDD